MSTSTICDARCHSCATIFREEDITALQQLWNDVKICAARLNYTENSAADDTHFKKIFWMFIKEWTGRENEMFIAEDDSSDDDYMPTESSSDYEDESMIINLVSDDDDETVSTEESDELF